MSQNGTPHSRSRSSSLVSSWNLPNIGASPVSSPPRTPPPFMSPVLELVSWNAFFFIPQTFLQLNSWLESRLDTNAFESFLSLFHCRNLRMRWPHQVFAYWQLYLTWYDVTGDAESITSYHGSKTDRK